MLERVITSSIFLLILYLIISIMEKIMIKKGIIKKNENDKIKKKPEDYIIDFEELKELKCYNSFEYDDFDEDELETAKTEEQEPEKKIKLTGVDYDITI